MERVDETVDADQHAEMFRSLSLNCSVSLGRAAFEAACKCYPPRRLVLKWGAYIVEKYEPPKKQKASAYEVPKPIRHKR